jgi:hypothetical protein
MLQKNTEKTIWEQVLRQQNTQTKRYENRCSCLGANLSQVTDKLYHIMLYRVRLEVTPLVVIVSIWLQYDHDTLSFYHIICRIYLQIEGLLDFLSKRNYYHLKESVFGNIFITFIVLYMIFCHELHRRSNYHTITTLFMTSLVSSNSSSYHSYICTNSANYQYRSRPTSCKVNKIVV